MKRNGYVFPAVIGALVAALAVSCAGPSGIQAYVPESAAVYAQVSDLETLLTNGEGFIKEIGSQALLDNKSLKEFLDKQLSDTMEGVTLSMFDLKKPLGVAVILPGISGGDPVVIAYLPMKDAKKDFETLKKAILPEEGSGTTKIAQAGSYAIVYDSPDEMKFPPQKTLDISSLKAYKADALAYVVNVKGLMAQYGSTLDAGVGAAANQLSAAGGANGAETAAMVEKIGKAFADGVRELDSLNGAFILTKDGLESRSSLAFTKDSGLAKLAKAMAASKGTASYAKYLPTDHLLSLVTNMSPEARKMATDFFLDLFGTIPGVDKADADFYRAMTAKYAGLTGNRQAMGFDFGLDTEALAQLEQTAGMDPAEVIRQVFNAFSFNVAMVQEAKDGPGYLEAVRASYADPQLASLMSKSTQGSGLRVSMAMEDKKSGDFPYTEMKILMSITSAKKLGLSGMGVDQKTMEGVFQKLTDKMLGFFAATKDKLYMTMGDGGLETLMTLAKSDAHPQDLSKDPAYTAFAKIAGDDGQLMMRLSTYKLMSFITTIIGTRTGGAQGFTMPEGSNTGMWAAVKADGSTLKATGFWSAKEIAAVVQQAMSLYMSSIFSDTSFSDEYSGDMSDYEVSSDEQPTEDMDYGFSGD